MRVRASEMGDSSAAALLLMSLHLNWIGKSTYVEGVPSTRRVES
jgi:hypothetical protein